MNIAISQTANSEDRGEQYRNTVQHLELAAAEGADLVVFPELSLVGFTRALPARFADPATPRQVDDAIDACDRDCRRLGLRALVGAVEFVPGRDKPLNKMVLLGGENRLAWYKTVPWNNEVRYFSEAPAGDIYQDGLGVLICSEFEQRYESLVDDSMVAWPGMMSREWADDPDARFFEFIRHRNLRVLYANWSGAPNVPSGIKLKDMGQSCLIDRDGIAMEAPKNTPGLLKCFDDGAFLET